MTANTNPNPATVNPSTVNPDTLAAAIAAATATAPTPAEYADLFAAISSITPANLANLAAAIAAAPTPANPTAAAALRMLAAVLAVAIANPSALIAFDNTQAAAALGMLDAIDAALVAAKTAAAAAPNATLAALAAHNAAPRKAYKLTAGDTLAALTLDGVTAYYAKTLDQWAGGFAGTDYAIESATTAVKHNKRGDYLEVVAATANFGKVHITTNSTTSIDYRRLTASFVKKCDNRAARAANKSTATGRRAPVSDVKRAAQAVNRYARAAVKRLDGDKNANKKLRTMITNHLSSVCVERDVNRADVVAALNDATRAFVS